MGEKSWGRWSKITTIVAIAGIAVFWGLIFPYFQPWKPPLGVGYSAERMLFATSYGIIALAPLGIACVTYAATRPEKFSVSTGSTKTVFTLRMWVCVAVIAAAFAVGQVTSAGGVDIAFFVIAFSAAAFGPVTTYLGALIGMAIGISALGAYGMPIMTVYWALRDSAVWALISVIWWNLVRGHEQQGFLYGLRVVAGYLIAIALQGTFILSGYLFLYPGEAWVSSIVTVLFGILLGGWLSGIVAFPLGEGTYAMLKRR